MRPGGESSPLSENPGHVDYGAASLSTDWSVPWSDLMMVMFVLFVVLFVYQQAERDVAQAFRQQDPPTPHSFERPVFREPALTGREHVLERSREIIREAGLGEIDAVLQADDSVKVSMSGAAYFDLGSAELKPDARLFLDELAGVLRSNPYEIRVAGHTDNFPIHSDRFPTNWELSSQRASAVARHLIERGQLVPGRFTVIGHSMYRPAVPNTSRDQKALNRRVEIVITRDVYPSGWSKP